MKDTKRVLFFDVETSGIENTLEDLGRTNSRLRSLWEEWQDKYKESNGNKTQEEVWESKAGLHAEYGRVVCVSMGYFSPEGEKKIQSLYGSNESDTLKKFAQVVNNSDAKGFSLGGHNIERFDCPFLWKRMLSNGIKPPQLLSVWDKKPWETKMVDTAKLWSGGAWKESFTSLDTLCAALGVVSPKVEMKGTMVHKKYWSGNIEEIKDYCEKDVSATMDVCRIIFDLLD